MEPFKRPNQFSRDAAERFTKRAGGSHSSLAPMQCRKLLILTGLALALFLLPSCKGGSSADSDKARQLIEQGDYDKAYGILNSALADAPKDPNLHLNLGFWYLYTNNIEKARKELTKAEELGPDLAETWHLRGALSAWQAENSHDDNASYQALENSVEQYQQALAKDGGNYQTYFDLADSLLNLGRPEEAVQILDKGYAHIPHPGDDEGADAKENARQTRFNFKSALCTAQASLENYQQAVEACKQAREFAASKEDREHIDEITENMRLMSPSKAPGNANASAPQPTPEEQKKAEQEAIENENASD